VICEELPVRGSDARISNSDPVTGQAAWYDVRVRVLRDGSQQDDEHTAPRFEPLRLYPGMSQRPRELAGPQP
jgi:hypothetical protein